MTPRHVLVALFGLTVIAGLADARQEISGVASPTWSIVSTLAFSFLCFYWYRLDSLARGYRPSVWLNVGVVALAIVAVPYYLVRSRPAGARARALLRFGGFALLLAGAAMLGLLAAWQV